MSEHIPTTEDLYEQTVEIYRMFVNQSPEAKAKSLARLKRAIKNEKDAEIKDFLQKLLFILQGTAERMEREDLQALDTQSQTAADYSSDLEEINRRNIEAFERLEVRKAQ